MKICVLDLEMNRPSKKIIQIGACCLDVKTGRFTDTSYSVFVNPHEPIDPFITDLCEITDDMVSKGGLELDDALKGLWEWMEKHGCQKHVAAWGNDWSLILQPARAAGIVFAWPKILDVKEMASVMRCAFPNSKARGGLAPTIELFGGSFKGRQHHALTDAKNTAHLLYKFKRITEKYTQINSLMAVE